MTDLQYHNARHKVAMRLWRETGRKYWLKDARRSWRQIVNLLGGLE